MDDPGGVRGKVALVTGGTRGIGFHIARRLAEQGALVTVNGRSAQHGEEALARLREMSPHAAFEAGEAGDYESIAAVVARTVERAGGLDIVVSAGAEGNVGPTPFADMTPGQIDGALRSRAGTCASTRWR